MREELLQERKKAIYGLICDELYVPMKAKEIAAVLNVPKSDRRDLAEVLDALVAEGKVEVSSKGKYMKSEGKFLTGVFTAHPRGFGFVTVEEEDEAVSSAGRGLCQSGRDGSGFCTAKGSVGVACYLPS